MLSALAVFAVAFGAVLLLERAVHRTLQSIALIMTGHADPATLLYAIPLFPGVALHETSHAIMAVLLGVKVRHFSLWPTRTGGGIRLGYVEVLRADAIRSSIIGGAPFIFGTLALSAIGLYVFNSQGLMTALTAADPAAFAKLLTQTISAPDAWIWFYLVFAIANSMMPSPADTQSWPPVIGGAALIGALLAALGGAELLQWLITPALTLLRWLGAAFAITAFIDIVVIAVLWVARKALERVSGRRVEYRN